MWTDPGNIQYISLTHMNVEIGAKLIDLLYLMTYLTLKHYAPLHGKCKTLIKKCLYRHALTSFDLH
jgi:hypothetical protein